MAALVHVDGWYYKALGMTALAGALIIRSETVSLLTILAGIAVDKGLMVKSE